MNATYTKRFAIHVPARYELDEQLGVRALITPAHVREVTLQIDEQALAQLLGTCALKSESGKSILAGGAIRAIC